MKTLAVFAFLVVFTITGAAAQTAAPVARTPDGQPDIQGYWTEEAGGPDAVNVENGFQTADSLRVQGWTEARLAARVPVSAIIDAPGGRIPYQPWAQKRREEIFHRYGGDDITGEPQTVRDVSSELLCVIGTPRLMFFADFQIVQTPQFIVMSWERSSDFRIIPLFNRPPLAEQVKLHNGDSRGHWEGNTLVVETSNLNDWSWFDSKGSFHTDALLWPNGRITPLLSLSDRSEKPGARHREIRIRRKLPLRLRSSLGRRDLEVFHVPRTSANGTSELRMQLSVELPVEQRPPNRRTMQRDTTEQTCQL